MRSSKRIRLHNMGKKEIREIELNALVEQASVMKAGGARLVQICCVKEPAGKAPAEYLELHYTFDRDYDLTGYKIRISPGAVVPSITAIYACAFLYENEMHDLFGIEVSNINIDFKGTFYKLAVKRPFNPEITRDAEEGEKAD